MLKLPSGKIHPLVFLQNKLAQGILVMSGAHCRLLLTLKYIVQTSSIMLYKYMFKHLQKLLCVIYLMKLWYTFLIMPPDGDKPVKNNHQKLGSAGLALHYANIITQIDTLVSFIIPFSVSLSYLCLTDIISFSLIS